MAAPVLTCLQFDPATQTCTQQAWVEPPPSVFPSLSAADGQMLGLAILSSCAILWASKLPRRS